jgi:hypothetical protein
VGHPAKDDVCDKVLFAATCPRIERTHFERHDGGHEAEGVCQGDKECEAPFIWRCHVVEEIEGDDWHDDQRRNIVIYFEGMCLARNFPAGSGGVDDLTGAEEVLFQWREEFTAERWRRDEGLSKRKENEGKEEGRATK